jgi:hypothetical protein
VPKLQSYPRRVLTKAFRETTAFTLGKLLVSALMGMIVRAVSWEFSHTEGWHELVLDLSIFAGCYAAVSITAFIVNLFRAPALLDAACQKEINRLSAELEFPDKAQAEYLRGLLMKLSDSGKAVLRFALFHEEITR